MLFEKEMKKHEILFLGIGEVWRLQFLIFLVGRNVAMVVLFWEFSGSLMYFTNDRVQGISFFMEAF